MSAMDRPYQDRRHGNLTAPRQMVPALHDHQALGICYVRADQTAVSLNVRLAHRWPAAAQNSSIWPCATAFQPTPVGRADSAVGRRFWGWGEPSASPGVTPGKLPGLAVPRPLLPDRR